MSIIGDWWFTLPNDSWVAEAVCATVDPELFHPPKGGSTRDAKRICHTCPVEIQCRDYAITHRESGIWGGTSDRERAKIRREAA